MGSTELPGHKDGVGREKRGVGMSEQCAASFLPAAKASLTHC